MPRTSQRSTTRVKEAALRTRVPQAVTTGSSTYSCILPGAHEDEGDDEASEIIAWVHRAGRAAT